MFQLRAISAAGEVVVRRQLKRRQVLQFFAAVKPCLIGMEACATAHRYSSARAIMAQAIRAILLANSTAAALADRRLQASPVMDGGFSPIARLAWSPLGRQPPVAVAYCDERAGAGDTFDATAQAAGEAKPTSSIFGAPYAKRWRSAVEGSARRNTHSPIVPLRQQFEGKMARRPHLRFSRGTAIVR